MRKRHQVLEQEAQRLVARVKKHGLLKRHEGISVEVRVARKPLTRPQVKVQSTPRPPRYTRRVDRPLTKEDWRVLLSYEMPEFLRHALEKLRKNGNQPTTVRDLGIAVWGQFLSMNSALSAKRALYRLVEAGERRNVYWEDQQLMVSVVSYN